MFKPSAYSEPDYGWAQVVAQGISTLTDFVTPLVGQQTRAAQAETEKVTALAQLAAETRKAEAEKAKQTTLLILAGGAALLLVGGYFATRR